MQIGQIEKVQKSARRNRSMGSGNRVLKLGKQHIVSVATIGGSSRLCNVLSGLCFQARRAGTTSAGVEGPGDRLRLKRKCLKGRHTNSWCDRVVDVSALRAFEFFSGARSGGYHHRQRMFQPFGLSTNAAGYSRNDPLCVIGCSSFDEFSSQVTFAS